MADRSALIVPLLVLLLAGGIPSRSLAAVAAQVSAGVEYTCAVDAGGGVACWGRNTSGQLGDGTTTQRTTPTGVVGLTSGVAAVSAAHRHTCALTATGGVKCWGRNQDGELGNGTTADSLIPVDVTGLASGAATSVSTGARHACAVTAGGGVKCWGDNTSGALGDGTTTDSSVPVDVLGLESGVAELAAGSDYTCARTVGGGVKCWGEGSRGELGDGLATDSAAPVDVAGLASGVSALSTTTVESRSLIGPASFPTCVVASGGVRCWGTSTFNGVPGDVHGLTSGVAAIDAGGYGIDRGLAILDDGGVTTFDMRSRLVGAPVNGLQGGVASASAGEDHFCVVTTDGEILCKGSNGFGALGSGATTGGGLGCVVGFGDGDFDRVCDDSDPCTAGQTFGPKPVARLSARRIGVDPTAGNDQLSFRAQTNLAPGVGFAELDLLAAGVLVTVVNPGGIDFERSLAAGAYGGKGTAGWALNRAGSRWTYTDATAPRGAVIAKLTVTDRSRGLPGGPVDVNLALSRETLPIVATDLPLNTIVVLGDASAGAGGLCAQTSLRFGCAFNGSETAVTCR